MCVLVQDVILRDVTSLSGGCTLLTMAIPMLVWRGMLRVLVRLRLVEEDCEWESMMVIVMTMIVMVIVSRRKK